MKSTLFGESLQAALRATRIVLQIVLRVVIFLGYEKAAVVQYKFKKTVVVRYNLKKNRCLTSEQKYPDYLE